MRRLLPGGRQRQAVGGPHHKRPGPICSAAREQINAGSSTVTVERAGTDRAQKLVPRTLDEAVSISRAFNQGFMTSQYVEASAQVTEIQGELPKGLRGTLLRNGPGLFEVGGRPVPQPFDGDGLVASLSFDGQGHAYFRNRFVRTPGFLAERRSGKQLYRSAFNRGLPDEGDNVFTLQLPFMQDPIRFSNPFAFEIKDTANTAILRWAGKTLALYERGMPWSLSPELETLGPDTLGGTVDGRFMGAHHRIIKEQGGSDRLIMFSYNEAGMDAKITLYEYDQSGRLLHRSRHTLPGAAFGMFHDIAVTQHFYILLENPLTPDVAQLLTKVPLGQAAIVEALQFDARKAAKLHLIPRPGTGLTDTRIRTYPVPPGFTFHHINAYEINPDGSEPAPLSGAPGRYLVLDTGTASFIDLSTNVETSGCDYWGDPRRRTQYTRSVVDLQRPTGSKEAVVQHVVSERGMEFGIVSPGSAAHPHRHVWMLGSPVTGGSFFSPLQAVCKVDIDPLNGVGRPFDPEQVSTRLWQPPGLQFPSEPAFIPASAAAPGSLPGKEGGSEEDEGWIATVVFDSERVSSRAVLLDARDLSEVASLALPVHVPQGLHGQFSHDYLGPDPGAPFTPQRYDIRDGV